MLANMSAGVKSDKGAAAALAKISSLLLVEENVEFLYKHGAVDWLLAILKSLDGSGPAGSAADNRQKMLAAACRGILRSVSATHCLPYCKAARSSDGCVLLCVVCERSCAAGNESRIYTVMAKGGVSQLISVLNAHAKDELVAQSALSALGALMGSRKENGLYIAQSGGIGAALSVLGAQPASAPIARAALELFAVMAAHVETGALLVSGGVIRMCHRPPLPWFPACPAPASPGSFGFGCVE